MDIIICIIIFAGGIAIGLMIGLIIWLKQLSDDITKFDIERCKIQAELDTLKVYTYGNDDN